MNLLAMENLATLERPRVFPPKKFFLIVWILTLSVAIFGVWIAAGDFNRVLLVWSLMAAVALWQIWTTRWVQVDNEGIRMRNIFQRGRMLRWDEITKFREEVVALKKGSYVVLKLSNEGAGNGTGGRVTRISLTSDQVGFPALREIVLGAVPEGAR